MATKADTRKKQGKAATKTGRGAHPNSRANLEKGKWEPGESGNPAGRPEGAKSRSTILNKWLSVELDLTNPVTREKERGTVEDEVILALITKARKGDVGAIREILDSTYGKLKDKTEHSFDFSNVSDEELKQGEQLLSKLIGK